MFLQGQRLFAFSLSVGIRTFLSSDKMKFGIFDKRNISLHPSFYFSNIFFGDYSNGVCLCIFGHVYTPFVAIYLRVTRQNVRFPINSRTKLGHSKFYRCAKSKSSNGLICCNGFCREGLLKLASYSVPCRNFAAICT